MLLSVTELLMDIGAVVGTQQMSCVFTVDAAGA